MARQNWLFNWRLSSRMMVVSAFAGAGLLLATIESGTAQIRRDVDPDRPPVAPPTEPAVEPELRRGLPPERTSPGDTPVTRPATLSTFTGKVALVEADDDKVTLLIGDEEEKTFTVADDAKITLNSKPARLKDLQLGDVLKVAVHKTEPSIAQSIVAARVTETSDEEAKPPRYSIVGTEGPKGGGHQGQGSGRSGYAQGGMNSSGPVGAVMPFQGRVFVMQLQNGTPAAELGFQPGDTILIVGANGLLPTATDVRGGQINAAQMQSGLVVVPPGVIGGNAAGGTIPGGATRGAVGTGVVPAGGVAPIVAPGLFPATGNQNGNNQNGNQNPNGNQNNPGAGNNPGTGTNNTGTGAAGARGPVTPGAGAGTADRNTQGTGTPGRAGTVTPGSGAAQGGTAAPRGGSTPR